MPKEKLTPAIHNKRRGLLLKTAFLHNEDAHPHVAATTIDTSQNLKFEVLPHPPYSPDLALCDFHASSPLTEALCGCRFGSREEAKEAVHTWIREQSKTFFSDRIRKLVDCYKKCVELQGHDFEK
jgi:hypothetical protein